MVIRILYITEEFFENEYSFKIAMWINVDLQNNKHSKGVYNGTCHSNF